MCRVLQLQEQGDSLPKLEEGLKVALSDKDKYVSLLEQLKLYKQTLQDKIDKRVEEEQKLKVDSALFQQFIVYIYIVYASEWRCCCCRVEQRTVRGRWTIPPCFEREGMWIRW